MNKFWTPEEIEIARSSATPSEAKEKLPHRTLSAIASQRVCLGAARVRRWLPEELEIISRDIPIEEMARLLPNRSLEAIKLKRSIEGISKPKLPRWEPWEVELMKARYPTGGTASVLRDLPVHRTKRAIIKKAHELGLVRRSLVG